MADRLLDLNLLPIQLLEVCRHSHPRQAKRRSVYELSQYLRPNRGCASDELDGGGSLGEEQTGAEGFEAYLEDTSNALIHHWNIALFLLLVLNLNPYGGPLSVALSPYLQF